ncbi:MAG: hypothetical protein AAF721_37560, partial [Myxococcota bacterium]
VLAPLVQRPPNPEDAIAIAEALAKPRSDRQNNRARERVGAVLLRGLQSDPAMRFASMDALLAALKPRPRGRRGVWAAAVSGALATAALLAWPNLAAGTVAAVAAPSLPDLEASTAALGDPTTDALLRLAGASRDRPENRDAYRQLAWSRLKSITDPYTQARLRLSLGIVALERHRDTTAQRHLQASAQLADQVGADELAARAHTQMARALVDREPSRALESVRFASAALERLDPPPPRRVVDLALTEAKVHQALGDHDAAIATVDRAIALGKQHALPRRYDGLHIRCVLFLMEGNYREGRRSCSRAVEQAVALGAAGRDQLPIRGNLMTAAMGIGDLPGALAQGEALLPLAIAEYGPNGLVVIQHRVNLIDLSLSKDDIAGAKRMLQENHDSLECCHPDAYEERATNYAGFGFIALRGDLQEAKRWYSKALVEIESNGAASFPKTVDWRAQLSHVERMLGSYPRARRHADTAIESARAIGPTANSGLSLALSLRADINIHDERFEDAREDLLESLDAGMGTRESPHPTQALAVKKLALVEVTLGNAAEARRLLGQMLATLEGAGLGSSTKWVECRYALAQVLRESDADSNEAVALARETLAVAREGRNPDLVSALERFVEE